MSHLLHCDAHGKSQAHVVPMGAQPGDGTYACMHAYILSTCMRTHVRMRTYVHTYAVPMGAQPGVTLASGTEH